MSSEYNFGGAQNSLQQLLHLTKRAGIKNYKTESQWIFILLFFYLHPAAFVNLV